MGRMSVTVLRPSCDDRRWEELGRENVSDILPMVALYSLVEHVTLSDLDLNVILSYLWNEVTTT